MATPRWREKSSSVDRLETGTVQDDSSESEGETEAVKSFHRRISTNKDIKTTVSSIKTPAKVGANDQSLIIDFCQRPTDTSYSLE